MLLAVLDKAFHGVGFGFVHGTAYAQDIPLIAGRSVDEFLLVILEGRMIKLLDNAKYATSVMAERRNPEIPVSVPVTEKESCSNGGK